MATEKELFLKDLQGQINGLQSLYDYVKGMPEHIYAAMAGTMRATLIKTNTIEPVQSVGSDSKVDSLSASSSDNERMEHAVDDNLEFGGYKKLVYDIIKGNNSAIRKRQIVSKFRELNTDLTEDSAVKSVTYALSGLKNDGSIKRYSPSPNGGVKNGYWTLVEWWNGTALKNDYKPRVNALYKALINE